MYYQDNFMDVDGIMPDLPVSQGLEDYFDDDLKLSDSTFNNIIWNPTDFVTSPSAAESNTTFSSFGEAMGTEETSQSNMQTVNYVNTVATANTGPATYAPTTSGQTHQLPHTSYIPNPSGTTSNAYAQPAGASTQSIPDANGCATMEMSFEGIEPSLHVDSLEFKKVMEGCPRIFEEGFSSLEMSSSHRTHEEVPTAVVPPSPRPNSSIGQLRSGVPPTPSPVSETGTTQHDASSSTNLRLPESHEFKVTVNFLNVQMFEETVIEPNGCVLFYKHRDRPTMLATPRENMKKVAITTFITKEKNGTTVEEEVPWQKETQKKYTEMILNSFDKGVSLYSRDLNLYAKRHCNTKLFWTSTESRGNVVHAKELVRETETEIFNWQRFEDEFKNAYCSGKQKEVRLPAVRFSFAQKWDTSSCPLNTKLVSARVEPLKAGEMIRWVNPEVQPASHYDSLHTSLFQLSHTSSNTSSTD